MRRYAPGTIAFLLLIPSVVLADGISPILNLFHKDTWLPAAIVTLVIIILETVLLRWRIKGSRFSGALWRSTFLNVASSITGSVVLLAFARDSFFIWDTGSLILPLFIITLLTEIPLLHILFKSVRLSWRRAIALGFGINITSYIVVFLVEIGLVFGLISYTRHLDEKELFEWNRPELLQRATGLIYTTESSGLDDKLKVFNPQVGEWKSLSNCPSIDPRKWDVEGNRCAFVLRNNDEWQDMRLVTASLPDFTYLHEMKQSKFADDRFDNWRGITDLAISPDQQKLAILFRLTYVVAYKDQTSHYALGNRCSLIVIEMESGKEIARASRWASDSGLCWLPDSRRVLFSSFDEESLYNTRRSEVRGNDIYSIEYAKDGRFSQSLYAFDIITGETGYFSDGNSPFLSVSSKHIIVHNNEKLLILDQNAKKLSQLEIPRLEYGRVAFSPSGEMLLTALEKHNPFSRAGLLTFIDVNNPAIRHVLADNIYYRFDWAIDKEDVNNNKSLDLHSPESTVIGFTKAAAKGDAESAQLHFLPDGEDYQDIWDVLTSDGDSERYPGRLMLESVDINQPIKVKSKEKTEHGLKVIWRVTFKNKFEIEGHTIEAGTQYEFDATLKQTEKGWLIDNF